MSRLALILSVSLAANAAIGIVAWRQRESAPAAAAPGSPVFAAPPPEAVNPDGIDAEMWLRLVGPEEDEATLTDAENDATLLARLRAAGFPPAALRAIFKRRLDERYAAQEIALIVNQPPATYWQVDRYGDADTAEMRSARRALGLTKSNELRALLGEDADSPATRRLWERRYGGLSAGKVEALETTLADYQEMENAIRMNAGILLPDDRAKLALIGNERQRDIAALLTPAEQAAYDARSGSTAMQVQFRLQDFPVTENEYLALVALQSEFNAEWSYSSTSFTREQRTARTEAQKQLEASVEATLGAERYAEYALKSDSNYLMTKRLTDRLGLPAANALSLAALEKTVREQQNAIYRDRTLSPDGREAQLTTLQAQTRETVAATLTADGAEVYEASFGQWINFIVPPHQPGR